MAVTNWMAAGTCVTDNTIGTQAWYGDDIEGALTGDEVDTDDADYAGSYSANSAVSHWLKCTNLANITAEVPEGATIDGFEVRYRRFRTYLWEFTILSTAIKFVKANTVVGNDIGDSVEWPDAEAAATYGGATEKGGQTWDDSEVRTSNFGVAFSITWSEMGSALGVAREAFVDLVEMRVYYTAGPVGESTTGLGWIVPCVVSGGTG